MARVSVVGRLVIVIRGVNIIRVQVPGNGGAGVGSRVVVVRGVNVIRIQVPGNVGAGVGCRVIVIRGVNVIRVQVPRNGVGGGGVEARNWGSVDRRRGSVKAVVRRRREVGEDAARSQG